MMRMLDYFVTESSEHQSEYAPCFIHQGEEVIDDFLIPIDENRRRCEAIIASWQQEERNVLGEGARNKFEVAPLSDNWGWDKRSGQFWNLRILETKRAQGFN